MELMTDWFTCITCLKEETTVVKMENLDNSSMPYWICKECLTKALSLFDDI